MTTHNTLLTQVYDDTNTTYNIVLKPFYDTVQTGANYNTEGSDQTIRITNSGRNKKEKQKQTKQMSKMKQNKSTQMIDVPLHNHH